MFAFLSEVFNNLDIAVATIDSIECCEKESHHWETSCFLAFSSLVTIADYEISCKHVFVWFYIHTLGKYVTYIYWVSMMTSIFEDIVFYRCNSQRTKTSEHVTDLWKDMSTACLSHENSNM